MLSFAALIAIPLYAGTVPPGSIHPICRNPAPILALGDRRKSMIHPLGDEPPAKQIKAVVRVIDGCNTPLVVAENVGAPRR